MALIISDANIFIDFYAGDILPELFQLSAQVGTPDILFEDELRTHHPNLIALGLHLIELDAPTILLAAELVKKYPKSSRLDLTALAAALHARCPLITGDQHLRKAASREKVTVYGTLWVAEQLVTQQIINADQLRAAYAAMRDRGRRLPWSEAHQRLDRLMNFP